MILVTALLLINTITLKIIERSFSVVDFLIIKNVQPFLLTCVYVYLCINNYITENSFCSSIPTEELAKMGILQADNNQQCPAATLFYSTGGERERESKETTRKGYFQG